MKPTLSFTLLTLAASALTVSAQTATKPAAAKPAVAHKPATAAAATAPKPPACVTLPPVSDKIPALPATANCVKPLYALTVHSNVTLDYASPLLNPGTAEALSPPSTTIMLLYVDTKVGTGELAKPGKWYTVNYTGYLPDGTKFDSSEGKDPISFPYGQHAVIAGWDTGFDGMHVGGKRRLYIPFQLGYGEKGHPPTIPAKSELIFDMELVAQGEAKPEPKPAPAPAAAPAPSPAGAAAPPPASSTTPAAPAGAKPAPPAAK